MARKRMIDPNIWDSEDFSKISYFSRLIWIGLFSNADDDGRGRAKPAYVKSTVFKYDTDEKLIRKVDAALDEIAQNMSVAFFREGDNEYYQLLNWNKFQRVEKPQPSQIPPLQDGSVIIRRPVTDQSPIIPRPVTDQSPIVPRPVPPSIREEKRREVKGREREEKCAHAQEQDDRIGMGFFGNVFLTITEVEKLKSEFGEHMTLDVLEQMSKKCKASGLKFEDYFAEMLRWCEAQVRRNKQAQEDKDMRAINKSFQKTSDPFLEALTKHKEAQNAEIIT